MLLRETNMKKREQTLLTAALFAGSSGDRRDVDLSVSSPLPGVSAACAMGVVRGDRGWRPGGAVARRLGPIKPKTLVSIVSLVMVVVLADAALHAVGSQYSIKGAGTPESMLQLIGAPG